MKLYLLRHIKILFIRLKLHYFFGLFNGFFSNLQQLSSLSSWAHKNGKITMNDFPSKWDYEKRYPMYEKVLLQEGLKNSAIDYFEFGVASGVSFKWFAAQNKIVDSRFYGFDTFTGLPEDYGSYKKGTFNTNTLPPVMDDSRVAFFQGLFQQTLPGFLSTYKNQKRKVIMLDADLYSATLFVLSSFAPFLQKGDIIFFDEFAVPTHEFKAFKDFTDSFYVKLELIAAANNYYFTAFKVM